MSKMTFRFLLCFLNGACIAATEAGIGLMVVMAIITALLAFPPQFLIGS